MILRAMDPLRELSFFGLFSSIVRTPYFVEKRTSFSSSPGNSFGMSVEEANCHNRNQYLVPELVDNSHTVRFAVMSGFVILARRGMTDILVREIQLVGCVDLRQGVRRSIGILAVRGYRGRLELAGSPNLGSSRPRPGRGLS